MNAQKLERDLKAAVRGEVRFDDGYRALYATDSSNYRMPPIGVVIPRSRDEIVAAVRVCREHGAPVLSRGGGTSLAGQCCNVAVVLDLSKYYHRMLAVDADRRLVRVEPGIVLDALQKQVAPHDLIFGPNPATHTHCTLGGMIGNNSCGNNSLLAANYGNGLRTSDNLEAMEILTYDGTIVRVGATGDSELERLAGAKGREGEIYRGLRAIRDEYAGLIRQRYPKIPRRVSGYNLDDLLPEKGFQVARSLSGSEGTCGVILEATLRLVPRPKARAVLVLGYPDAYEAGDAVPVVLKAKPIGLEGIDEYLVSNIRERGVYPEALKLLPKGGGWLLVEFGGDTAAECVEQARALESQMKREKNAPDTRVIESAADQENIWHAREAGLGVTAFQTGKPDTWEGWEDTAVAPERVGPYLRDFRAVLDRYGYHTTLYGHYGQGCIHCRIDSDLVTAEGLKHWRAFLDEASDLVIRYGGSYSGEHGDGQSKAELLPKLYGPELIEAFRRFKRLWDPEWKMNPGKIVDPNPILSHLRLGTTYNPAKPKTFFQFPADRGSFARATMRCVGVGECRREEHGTMCPSYMVTREEMHSTRGRAHLLFEMLEGRLLKKGFREPAVKEALDLCLACKGCKGDCPVHVDVATHKAEFLSHYYRGRLRPVPAYAFGLIARWARVAALAPAVANYLQRAPVLGAALKAFIGVARPRTIPRFAPQTFKQWFFARAREGRDERPARPAGRAGRPSLPSELSDRQVILWPDTFNNHYHPDVLQAATRFLEGAGWRVVVPEVALCCGRPLYDYGMLATARRWLQHILEALRAEIRAGVPVVGLEPSCVATFRDELIGLFPNDEDAQRLSQQTFLLGEFIDQKMSAYALPRLSRRAVVHAHCHQRAVTNVGSLERVLKRMGIDYELLESGCCGMAGAFGFEKEHYELSVACGERVLLPRVRAAAPDTLIIASGFSCREQIAQTTSRRALHLAHVLELAARGAEPPPDGNAAERSCLPADAWR